MTRDEAMALWAKADRAGEGAYVEAIQAGAVTADDAHKTGSLAAATVIQQAFAERDGEMFKRGAAEYNAAASPAKPSQPKEIAVVEAANDSYQDELAHALATMVSGMGPEVAGYITRPLSDGRRWSVMPLDAEQAMRDARDARIRQAGVQQGLDMAAGVAYRVCAETRHVSLGDDVEAAIRKLGGDDGTD